MLAYRSRDWVCPHCKVSNLELLPDPEPMTETETPGRTCASPPVTPVPAPAQAPIAQVHSGGHDHEDDLIPMHTVNPLTPSQNNTLHVPHQHNQHQNRGDAGPSPPAPNFVVARAGTAGTNMQQQQQQQQQKGRRPLVLLDTAIWMLVAVAAALIFRRIC